MLQLNHDLRRDQAQSLQFVGWRPRFTIDCAQHAKHSSARGLQGHSGVEANLWIAGNRWVTREVRVGACLRDRKRFAARDDSIGKRRGPTR